MKTFLLLSLFLNFTAQGDSSPCSTIKENLNGSWIYHSYIYQGQTHPRPNPKLLLYFEFFETGTNRVWWKRTNEAGFCERIGQFEYNPETCTFTDKIVWVNPGNNAECGSDPDMRLGREATSRLEHVDGALHLFFQLKGEPFIYVFEPSEN